MPRLYRRRAVFAAALSLSLTLAIGPLLAAPRQAPAAAGSVATKAVTPAAQVTHEPIGEMSGIVQSRRYPGMFWVHNDSGDTARLFAIHADGSVVMPDWLSGDFYVGEKPTDAESKDKKPYPGIEIPLAYNTDWEDITIDGDTLYVPDMGNNGNARRDLGVYVLPEPNPTAVASQRALKWLPVAYPDQKAFPDPSNWHFDCEAVFMYRGKFHCITKHRAPGKIGTPETGANLYRLDTQYTDRVNVLKKLDSAADLGGWVTGADVSPDGKTLAVLCQAPVASVWLFDISRGGDRLLSGPARRLILTGARQCEAVCFTDDATLLVTNEQRDIFRLLVSEFSPVSH